MCRNNVDSLEEVRKGFRILVAEALYNRANSIYDSIGWVYFDASGILLDHNSSSKNKQVKWILYEKYRPFAKDEMECFSFKSVSCCSPTECNSSCAKCTNDYLLLRKRCIRAPKNTANPEFVKGTTRNSILISPSNCIKKVQHVSSKFKKFQQRNRSLLKKF